MFDRRIPESTAGSPIGPELVNMWLEHGREQLIDRTREQVVQDILTDPIGSYDAIMKRPEAIEWHKSRARALGSTALPERDQLAA